MMDDPVRYWQELTENYRQMSDGELLELARKPEDLTEVARQVLRDETRKRRLDEASPAEEAPKIARGAASIRWESARAGRAPGGNSDPGDGSYELTWKTQLCECETPQQAWQLAEVLRRAGIDTWIEGARASGALDLVYPRVMVGADQLEDAQRIAEQPIPADIIAESMEPAPEAFEAPVCPRCGAADPVLCEAEEANPGIGTRQDADWVNTWQCEACGAEWSDEAGADAVEGAE